MTAHACFLMMSAEKAKALGYKPIARYVAATSTALSPSIMGYAPVSAVEKLEKENRYQQIRRRPLRAQ